MENNAALRADARKKLAERWFASAMVTAVYLLILGIANVLVSQIESFIGAILQVPDVALLGINLRTVFVGQIISSALTGPLAVGYLWYFLYIARGEPASLQNIFDGFRLFSKSFLLILIQSIFIMFWSLLLFVPGLIKGCSYALTFFILRDNPDTGVLAAITQSRRMMHGHKMRYFLLQLSFIGWFLLCILSAGIGLLWLMPYVYLTNAHFYEYLRKDTAS
jgi:uncharacterized membrane protein